MKRNFPPFPCNLLFCHSFTFHSFSSLPTPSPFSPETLFFNPHPYFKTPSPSSPIPPQDLIDAYTKPLQHCKTPSPLENSLPKSLHGFQNDSSFDSENYDNQIHRSVGSLNPSNAKQLHLHLVKNGLYGNLFLSNNLVNLYAKAGNVASAAQVFGEMPERNVVTWTCLISGHVQLGRPDDACKLFCSMIQAGSVPTHFTFGNVLRACQDSGADRLKFAMQVHGRISKTRYASDVVVCNALISMYGSCSVDSARYSCQVFDGMLMRNSISWNSIISVYSQRGDVFSAFGLFSEMQQEGVRFSLKPNEYTFGSLISAANAFYSSSECNGSHLLEQMLPRVMKSGFLNDLYVGSALVSAFSRSGLLDTAREIFGQMSDRNAVSMNGLMVGLVKQKRGEEALDVFRDTRDLVSITCDSYVVLLSACAEFVVPEEGRRKGREIHGFVIRSGLNDEKVAIGNGLVNMYAKCGVINDACTVFDLMGSKDLVSWNSMLAGLDQNRCFQEALSCYCTMRRSRLMPSNFALISTLSSCASLGCIKLGTQIHSEVIKLNLDSDVSVSNSLLKLYAESGYIVDCQKVFNLMPEHDQVSWNSMIGALADLEAPISEVVEVILDMMRAGWSLNRITFMNILSALSSLSILELGRQVHALVLKYHAAEDSAVENALLSCYAKSGEMDDCERLFVKMSERRDEVSWNSMIAGYIHNGLLPKALDIFWLMIQTRQRVDRFTFATVLSACASVAALERGTETHAHCIRACLGSDVVVESALIDMYSKCGRVDYAARVFGLMSLRNEFSWNSMISGYARHGHCGKALELFKEMQKEDRSPDHVTFVGVLSACSHFGLVDQGVKYFESMSKTYGLVPRMEHYSCIVDLLGRAGELDKVEDFIRRMPMKPNVLVWRTVLGACCRANGSKMDLGKQAAEMLLELEPKNPVNYVLISNMYASGGSWEDVAKTRARMANLPAKKEAGCSWVTLKDGVHVFIAGDKSHPETDAIYEKLYMLNQKIRDVGYVPQTKFALYDLEVENKEELLSVHSEKLAVSFVLIRTSELPIRIMKNLRVCGDCHSAFRYISQITKRQIILRDSNRFHHFDDGKCSCGDYW
ncbi:hypothetical protein AAC387_Pa02g3787 [Persea americana]